MEGQDQAVSALGALLNYLKDTQRKVPLKINRIENYTQAQFMGIDLNTRRNLELLETMRNKEKRGSLLWVLDQTKTAMGKRLLRTWIEQPLLLRKDYPPAERGGGALLRPVLVRKPGGSAHRGFLICSA